jgi:hypothetical protein
MDERRLPIYELPVLCDAIWNTLSIYKVDPIMDSKEMDIVQCIDMDSPKEEPTHSVISRMSEGFYNIWGGKWNLIEVEASSGMPSASSTRILETVVVVGTDGNVCETTVDLPNLQEQPRLERTVGYYQPEGGD